MLVFPPVSYFRHCGTYHALVTDTRRHNGVGNQGGVIVAEVLKAAAAAVLDLLKVYVAAGAAGGKLSIHAKSGKAGYSVGAGYRANVADGKGDGFTLGDNNTVQIRTARFSTEAEARTYFAVLCSEAEVSGWLARVKAVGKLATIPNVAVTDAPATDAPATDAPKGTTDAPATDAPATDAPKGTTDAPKGTAHGATRVHTPRGTATART